MDIDKEREAFEKWIANSCAHSATIAKDDNGDYIRASTQMYWRGWLARAKLCTQ